MKNWYCKPASEAEAIEIVERAVANGAKMVEAVNGMIGGRQYAWDQLDAWGCEDRMTYTYKYKDWLDSEQLTIQQVREQFPFPLEVKVMSDKKEWQPSPGVWVEVSDDVSAFYVGKTIEGMHLFQEKPAHNGAVVYVTQPSLKGLKPLRTERDKWIERAIEAVGGKQAIISAEVVLGKIYDNMIKEAE